MLKMETDSRPETSDINLKELETCFINSRVVTPFCISWSKDNKISVTVEGGVFMFELWPTPLTDQQTVTFSKSWIAANETTPLCNAVVENENGAFLWSLDRKQVYEVTIDSTLSHAVQKPHANFSSTHIVLCEFSPLIACKSYISCLTNNGLLEIYKKSLKKWSPVINVTQLWIMHCSFTKSSEEVKFDDFKSKMFRLKIISMKWVEEPEVLFMTAHENGEIVLWNIEVSNGNFLMSVRHCFKVEGKPIYLKLSVIPNTERSFLFVGMLSGIVKCLSVDVKTGALSDSTLWKYEDSLIPSRIITQNLFTKLFLFVVKRHILLIQALSVDESGQLDVSEPHCEEFPTAVIAWNEYQDSFLVCLQNHDVYILKIEYTNRKIICDKKIINTGIKKKHTSLYSCYGLTMSQNKALWILVSSAKVNYNSTNNITQLIIFSPQVKVFRSLRDDTSSGLIKKILNECKDVQLHEIFDLLELKKLELFVDNSKVKDDYDVDEELPLLQLQLMLWEVKLKLFCNYINQDSLVTKLEFAITKNRARKVVSALQKSDSLSLLEKKSLEICQMFLEIDEEMNRPLHEVCAICGSESFLYTIRISSCSNLHKFPLCCLSLLPCDTVPYAICENCESVALINFVVAGDNRCPFCDGLLEVDTRLRAV